MPLSNGPPTTTVLPSAEMDTDLPCPAPPTAPEPTSLFPCCVQTPPLLVQTHTAPREKLSCSPPTIAVLPSAEMDTETPWRASPSAPEPTNLACCVQTVPLLVQIQ